jgi:hypothetical protein
MTGSKVSLASANKTAYPSIMANLIFLYNKVASVVGLTIVKSFSIPLIQLYAYIYGSIIKGHLAEFSIMIAFSIAKSS